MGVNVYISCHVHVKAARSGRAALELLAVRKGWGYTNNEQYTCPSTEKNRRTLTLTSLTNPKLQLLSHAIHLFFVLQSKYYSAKINLFCQNRFKKIWKMEDMWEGDLELLHLLICGPGYTFIKCLKLSLLCTCCFEHFFALKNLLGRQTIGNQSHKLVTEAVPNPKKSNYIKKNISHCDLNIIWLTKKQTKHT